MKRIKLHDRSFRLMIEADVIDREIQRVGAQMNRELAGERPLFLGVLNGAFMFVSDLLKHITIEGTEISFVKIASYAGLSSTGKVQDLIGLREDITGRTVVILEDMIDSGESIMHMKKNVGRETSETSKGGCLVLQTESVEVRPNDRLQVYCVGE